MKSFQKNDLKRELFLLLGEGSPSGENDHGSLLQQHRSLLFFHGSEVTLS